MKRVRKFALVDKPPVAPTGPRTYNEKLADALAYLGERWVLHPQFKKERQRTGYLQQWRISRYNV